LAIIHRKNKVVNLSTKCSKTESRPLMSATILSSDSPTNYISSLCLVLRWPLVAKDAKHLVIVEKAEMILFH